MRYLITGGSGYIGTRLVERLTERDEVERIVVCDVRAPATHRPKVSFERLDVRDGRAVRDLLERERPDVLVHLAFLLNPVRDEALMYDVDVNGTHNVLEAASATGVGQVLVTSSAVAYGAHPDNPVPLTEDHPLRGNADFSYARDKTDSDRVCQLWALRHPDRVMTIVRPCIVFGPTVDNYLVRGWTKAPFAAAIGADDVPIQFVHVDDVAEAIDALLSGRHAGAYNVTSDDTIALRETFDAIGLRRVRMPRRAYFALARLLWRLRVAEAPPGSLSFVVNPWACSNEKLRRTTGWAPRWSSREVFELTMRAHDKLPALPAAEPERTPEPAGIAS